MIPKNKDKQIGPLKAQSGFASMLSHELKKPLTAIREGIAIVLDGLAGEINEEQRDFLNTAKRNVDRLARLINNVSDFQKLESGRAIFNKTDQDINGLASEARQAMLSLANNKGLEFMLRLNSGLPRVKLDKDKIMRVLTGVVNNAIEFTQQGSVAIITERRGNFIQVSVQDTGLGIKEEDMPKLFQEFSQIEKNTAGKSWGGSGLGMAISKKIIEAHGGKIWAESEFGKGTTVRFTLPVKERRV